MTLMTRPDRSRLWLTDQACDLEKTFLKGRRGRAEDLESAVRIFLEFLRGFESLALDHPAVTVFGSARFDPSHEHYKRARQVGRCLAHAGFPVMTGGGPGVMEAANRGAKESDGLSIGCNIVLPQEQKPNPYLDQLIKFDHFFVRKVMLVKYSCAFVVLPGGFGTLDEVFETAVLMQTDKIREFPIILMGQSYWRPLLHFLRETVLAAQTIDRQDLELFHLTDDPQEAVDIVVQRHGPETRTSCPSPLPPDLREGKEH